jgi:hypothetical protein
MSDIPPYAAPDPPDTRGLNGLLLGVVLAALLSVGACVFLVASVDGDGDGDGSSAGEAADVAPPTCQSDVSNHVEAVMTVTNPTSKRSNYVIDVVFIDPQGDAIDSETVTVRAVDPGATTTARAVTDTDVPDGGFTCRVTDVDRFSDEG